MPQAHNKWETQNNSLKRRKQWVKKLIYNRYNLFQTKETKLKRCECANRCDDVFVSNYI